MRTFTIILLDEETVEGMGDSGWSVETHCRSLVPSTLDGSPVDSVVGNTLGRGRDHSDPVWGSCPLDPGTSRVSYDTCVESGKYVHHELVPRFGV